MVCFLALHLSSLDFSESCLFHPFLPTLFSTLFHLSFQMCIPLDFKFSLSQFNYGVGKFNGQEQQLV